MLHVTYKNGLREDYVVRLAAGWCLMQSPELLEIERLAQSLS